MVAEVFSTIYHQNLWGGQESRSGPGSSLEQTVHVRAGLEALIRKYEPASLLDLPCGDAHWMMHVVESLNIRYLGADIVPEMIHQNRILWPQRRWQVLNICSDPLPEVDMIFCRDCLVHLSVDLVTQALRNVRHSGAKYLVMTTFPRIPEGNGDIRVGGWRRLDFTQQPFLLPPPHDIVNECRPGPPLDGDKSLGVWRISDLL